DHHPVRRQMGRDSGEHLAADALDVAGAQMVPEQTSDIGRAWRMAEGRRKLSAGEDRMSRQEARGLVLARLHSASIYLRQNGQLIPILLQICQLFLLRRPCSGGRP